MGAFAKFLVSLVMHLIWQRVGGKGAIPPVRLPRSNKPVPIPAVSTWQLMIAMWVLKKFWAQYGNDVKTRMTDARHPIPRRVGSWLPDVDAPATKSAPATSNDTATAPATNAILASTATNSTPAHSYSTQVLDADDAHSVTSSAPVSKRGSLLSSLRGSHSGSTS